MIAVVLGLTLAIPGQEPRWQLPQRGAAEFVRSWRARSGVADSAAELRRIEPRGAVPERFLPRLVPAPVLCQGELGPEQQAIADPPRDLRDVVRAVALDFSVRGRASWRFHRVKPFGDLVISGRVGRRDDDGWQDLALRVTRRKVAALAGDMPKTRTRHVAPLCHCKAAGPLTIRRHVDVGAGLVREFRAELSLQIDEGRSVQNRYRRIELEDHWELVAVRENQDADFRARVAAAVRAGSGWIHRTVDGMSKSFLEDGSEKKRSYGSGRIALAALALLHADVSPDDPVVRQAFAALRRRKLVDTYSLSTALMAMAQRYAPPRELELIRQGHIAKRPKRQLDERDRKVATRWLGRLLDNLDSRVDVDELARFTYAGGSWFDNSLTQYGLLGLDAAELCGLEVPRTVWPAAAAHLLVAQAPAVRRDVLLRLTTYRELAAAAGESFTPRAVRTAARGFAYRSPIEPSYGGMTAAGIAGLVLARAGSERSGLATAASLRAVDDGLESAFAWLVAEFTLRSNPGFIGKADHHWYYWLYALERACELAAVAHLQGRDWYYEGALQLLAQQQANGSFHADRGGTLLLDATCFSILFLKKATLPAATPR